MKGQSLDSFPRNGTLSTKEGSDHSKNELKDPLLYAENV